MRCRLGTSSSFLFRAHCLAATTVAYRTVGAGEDFLRLYALLLLHSSGLVTTILVARFWVLVVPTLVMRILLSLVMSSVGLAMFTAAIIRTAIAVMLRFDGTERQ